MIKKTAHRILIRLLSAMTLVVLGCSSSDNTDYSGETGLTDVCMVGQEKDLPFQNLLFTKIRTISPGSRDAPILIESSSLPLIDRDLAAYVELAYRRGIPVGILDADTEAVEALVLLTGCKTTVKLNVGDGEKYPRPAVALARKRGVDHIFEVMTESGGDLLTAEVSGLLDWLGSYMQSAETQMLAGANTTSELTDADITDLVDRPTRSWTFTDNGFYNQITVEYFSLFSCQNTYWVLGLSVTLETNMAAIKDNNVAWTIFSPSNYPIFSSDGRGSELDGVKIMDPLPQSATGTTSYTSGNMYSVSGTVGFSEGGGLSIGVSAGVTYVNTKTVNLPETIISNMTNIQDYTPRWYYEPSEQNNFTKGDEYTFSSSWIWTIPFNAFNRTDLCWQDPDEGTFCSVDFTVGGGSNTSGTCDTYDFSCYTSHTNVISAQIVNPWPLANCLPVSTAKPSAME